MQENDPLQIQRDLAVALNGESSLEAALAMCLATALEVSQMDGGGIYLVNDEGDVNLVASERLSDEFSKKVAYFGRDSQQARVVREGNPQYVNVDDTPDRIRDHCRQEGFKALALLPIRHLDTSIACINLGSRKSCQFPKSVRHQLEGLAAILGGVIARLQAEASSRQNAEMLHALLNATTESAFLLDLEGKIVVANKTLADRLNTTVPNLIGRNIADFVAPEAAARGRTHCEEIVKTGEPKSRVEEWDGRYFQRRIYPVCNEAGEVVLLAGFSAEITARRLAEQEIQAERRLLRELLDLQERERKLISHELHDGFVQDIIGAQMLLDATISKVSAADDRSREQMEAAQMLLQEAIVEARRMIRDLRPAIIRDDSGVVGALHDMVAQEERAGDLQIHLEHEVRFQRLDPMLEGTIFRIVHEALVNVRKHSGANAVSIRLSQPGDLVLVIEDRGKGFELSRIPPDRFGVRGIQERARLFGGRAEIQSEPGKGTRITVSLPVRNRSHAVHWIHDFSDDFFTQGTGVSNRPTEESS